MKTTENNKLIAEFMGIKYNPEGKREFVNNEWIYNKVEFHSSWSWLMPVVEKIEILGYNFCITSKDATVLMNHGVIYQSLIYKVDGLTKIQATYKTVVEFVKWYNEQTPKP